MSSQGCFRRLPQGCFRRLPQGCFRRLPQGCFRRLLPLALVASALGACRDSPEPTVVRSAGIEIRAAMAPSRPRVGENELRIELRDADGRAIDGAVLEARVEMAAMGAMPAMGGAASVSELGGGRYRAAYQLAMGGTWRVELRATPASGPAAVAEGSLTVGTAGLRLEAAGGGAGAAAHDHAAQPDMASPAAGEEPSSAGFQITPERLQRIGVRFARAERRALEQPIRAAGRVAYDETALRDVSLKVRGWVRDLRVDAVGNRVEAGEVLFTLYSPELYAAEQEYLLALRSQARARETEVPDRADALVAAARDRLRLWDVAAQELVQIERTGAPLEALPIRSPASGYVLEKEIVAGAAVEPAQRLYRIAPLDPVWVEAEVYEAELPLVRVGMAAELTLPYLPGRRFEGRVAWVHPGLSADTRTGRVRIELANPGQELRPDMLATIELRVPLGERLVVPLSAVLHAGDRSFVFLDRGEGRLEPRRVEVGARVGEEIEIRAGLEAGQAVVSSATFLVASESRLREALDRW
jgi:Cu(I)/Ag(I) efflux system membrane fusion protein